MPHPSSDPRLRRRWAGYAVAWLVAAVAAVTVGVVAVTSVGASIRDRGPTVNEAVRTAQLEDQADGTLTPPADTEAVRSEIREEFGVFVVECQGVVASGIRVDPAPGWRTVSYEQGPDDDVDAVFVQRRRSIEIEVYCARGEPVVADVEHNSLPEEDGD